jgi:hypothetical protein
VTPPGPARPGPARPVFPAGPARSVRRRQGGRRGGWAAVQLGHGSGERLAMVLPSPYLRNHIRVRVPSPSSRVGTGPFAESFYKRKQMVVNSACGRPHEPALGQRELGQTIKGRTQAGRAESSAHTSPPIRISPSSHPSQPCTPLLVSPFLYPALLALTRIHLSKAQRSFPMAMIDSDSDCS